MVQVRRGNSLATGTAIPPDIPGAFKPLFGPLLANLGARDALVVAVVPFADVLGDLYLGATFEPVTGCVPVGLPGECARNAQVQELKSPLGALAW